MAVKQRKKVARNKTGILSPVVSIGNHRMLDLFGPGSNVNGRVIRDYDKIEEIVKACRQLGLKVVLTTGTYDMLHVGHSRYLEKAKEYGDILIVGVDSDEETRRRKGPHRPIVAEDERMEILCHLRHVDLVFHRDTEIPKWSLIPRVRPDVLITTEGGFTQQELRELKGFCGEVVTLEPQATTSTTARIRLVLVAHAGEIREKVSGVKDKIQEVFNDVDRYLEELSGGGEE